MMDAMKEDKPLDKGQSLCIIPPKEDNLSTKDERMGLTSVHYSENFPVMLAKYKYKHTEFSMLIVSW